MKTTSTSDEDTYDWGVWEYIMKLKDEECKRLQIKYETFKQYYENNPQMYGYYLVLVGNLGPAIFKNEHDAVSWGLQKSMELKTPCPYLVQIGMPI